MSTNNKTGLSADAKTTILAIATGVTIAVGGMTIYSNQLDKEREAKVQAQPYTLSDTDAKIIEDAKLAYERRDYADNLAALTRRVTDMPASAERTAFSAAVIEVMADNVVTDDEYNKLEADYTDLKWMNEVNEINEIVAKYAPETNKQATTAEKS